MFEPMMILLLPFIYVMLGVLVIIIVINIILKLINKDNRRKTNNSLKIALMIMGGIMVMLYFLVSGKGNIIKPLIILLPVIAILAGIFIHMQEYRESKAKGTDSTMYAKVTKSEIEYYTRENRQRYKYNIEYEYDVNGVTYHGYGYSYYGKTEGQKIKIYYNSKNPQQNELAEKRVINRIGIIALIIIFLLVLPVIIAMFKG